MSKDTESQHSEASPQHTPGPWKIVMHAMSGPDIFGADGRRVAEVADWYDGQPVKQNANLIAAAPDLLAALQPFVHYSASLLLAVPGNQILEDMVEAAMQAVAKARGRQP